MIKTRIIKVKSIEDEEITMAMTMANIITTVIMKIITTMIIMTTKIGNLIKI